MQQLHLYAGLAALLAGAATGMTSCVSLHCATNLDVSCASDELCSLCSDINQGCISVEKGTESWVAFPEDRPESTSEGEETTTGATVATTSGNSAGASDSMSTSATTGGAATTTGAPVCGNGELEPGEECDDGDQSNDNACLNNCLRPRCGDGLVQEQNGEECDDGDLDDAHGCNTQCGRDRYVFLTSEIYDGDFGGVSGANSLCKKAAMIAGLPNYQTYRAWMSDDTFSPALWFFHSKGRYILTNGAVVANGWKDLTDGTIQRPIDIDENGEEIGGGAWSNTTTAGLRHPDSQDCMGWTIIEIPVSGRVGNTLRADAEWTDAAEYNPTICGGEHSFYCFEN
jgi:cysteine-rich repeat protein